MKDERANDDDAHNLPSLPSIYASRRARPAAAAGASRSPGRGWGDAGKLWQAPALGRLPWLVHGCAATGSSLESVAGLIGAHLGLPLPIPRGTMQEQTQDPGSRAP